MKTAVIILDMAKGYGWEPGSYVYEMVAKVKELKDAAHAAGAPVIHVNSLRRKSDNVGDRDKVLMKEKTDAVDVIPELQPVDNDTIVYKRYLSGFSYNDLDYVLRTMNCDTVLIAGASTDNTVLWTSADAFQLRYKVIVVEDCTMVHRENEPLEVKEYALRIIRNVLHSQVMPLADAIQDYIKPMAK